MTKNLALTPSPVSDDTSCTLSSAALRDLGHGILRSLALDSRIHAESPPEAVLGALLGLAARSNGEPTMDVRARERIVLATVPDTTVELDLVIRDLSTGASAVVEVDGWRWHRRSPQEHDEEIERDRRIRRLYPHMIRYSAAEVLRNPWRVLGDVFGHLRSWEAFEHLRMSVGLQAIAEACGSEGGSEEVPTAQEEMAQPPVSAADLLHQIAAALPPPPPTTDPEMQRIRQVHPRMSAPWQDDEVAVLADAFRACLDVTEIARAFGRSKPAVWAQLRRMQLIAG